MGNTEFDSIMKYENLVNDLASYMYDHETFDMSKAKQETKDYWKNEASELLLFLYHYIRACPYKDMNKAPRLKRRVQSHTMTAK